MKIASWNVNSVKMRLTHVKEFLHEHNPDILLLQELKCTTENFPYQELEDFNYNIYVHGQKSYNGVAILSKHPADEIITELPNNPCSSESRFIQARICTRIGFCNIISVYVPNGGEVGSDKFQLKLKFYQQLTNYLISIKNFDEKIIIGGDFNVAPFDIDVYNPKELINDTCFTQVERDCLRSLVNQDFVDAYRLFAPTHQEYSWWDYRAGKFEQNKGMRIDMLLLSNNVVQSFSNCIMDYKYRAKPAPSDHIPIYIVS